MAPFYTSQEIAGRKRAARAKRPGYYIVTVNERGGRQLHGPYPTPERARAAREGLPETRTPVGIVIVNEHGKVS